MIKRKALILVLLIGMLILGTNAFALLPGDTFIFTNTVYPGATNTWTHTLENADFDPELSGSEPLIIKSANDVLTFTITPEKVEDLEFPFYAEIQVLTLDGDYTGATFTYFASSAAPVTIEGWDAHITRSDALKSIADKTAGMQFDAVRGAVTSVTSSTLSVSGIVAPEPVSMLLVGIGMVGMPFAGRFRRFLRRSY